MKIEDLKNLPDSASLFGRIGLRGQCLNPYCRKAFVFLIPLKYNEMATAIMEALLNGDIAPFCQDCVIDMVARNGGTVLPVDAKTGEIEDSINGDK